MEIWVNMRLIGVISILTVETKHVLCSTVAQENSAFARCCVLGFAAA